MGDDLEKAADFDEETKRILKAEREDAERDAKYGASFAAMVFGLIPAGVIAWDCIRSVFFGARFLWSDLWLEIGVIGAIFFGAWIYYRSKTAREMRNARPIRIELKLDRLLKGSEEVDERDEENLIAQSGTVKRLDEFERSITGLQSTIGQTDGLSEHSMVKKLDERLEELRVQVKLARLFARIEDDLREIRRNLTTAQFTREGKKGFIPQDALNSDSENKARLKAAQYLDYIEDRLDYLETDKWGTADLELSISRCMDLESLQEEVREKAAESRSATLNEICDSLSWIDNRVITILEVARYKFLEKRAEQGDASAQYELGIAHRNGQRGIQDYEEAYYWLYLATAANFATRDVGPEAVVGARDDAASHLTPADLSRVQGRAKKWIRDHLADLSKHSLARRAHVRLPLPQ